MRILTLESRLLTFLPPLRWSCLVLCALAAVIAASGCDASFREGSAVDNDGSFTIVVLPDTQYYAADHPDILDAQAQWIVRYRDAERIALVVHEGDIVDADESRQWETAARSLHQLDSVVPYVLSVGNHDYRRQGTRIGRDSSINQYFPATELTSDPSAGGTFEPGHLENSFHLLATPAGPWLILSLEFGPRDAVLAWANAVITRYAGVPSIMVTHAYLYSDDTRYDHIARPDQKWNPHAYLADEHPGDVNDGEEMWRKLVAKNHNLRFVLCGHDLSDGVGRLSTVRPDGSVVHQLLANYQTGALGGDGFLRLMRFAPEARKVTVRTYSPFTNQFKIDSDNEFTLDY